MKNAPTKKLHPDFIEEVKQADIVDVISGYIDLKKRGREYLGLCPFHDERTPSFSVSPTKGLAHCFGCNWGGNAIKFLMELGKVSFTDAVMELARLSGVRIRYEDGTEEDLRDPLPRPALSRNSAAAEQALPEEPQKDYTVSEGKVTESVFRLLHHKGDAEKARAWLESRGITREMVKRYRLGLEKRVVTPDESKPERKETYWAIAIFIPVPNRPGRFYVKKRVAPWLSGADRPSYLGKWAQFGVPATIWFTHNLDDAHETWFAEGEWDAIRLGELALQRGEKIAVACSSAGAGSLPKQEELDRLPGGVTTLFDRDEAGVKGASKLVEALGERGQIALVPMKGDGNVKGWDVSNALDDGYTWEDFEAAASKASGYTASIQTPKHQSLGDRPISHDEWELKFGISGWLKQHLKHLKRLTNWQKTAAGSSKELPQIQPARVRTLHYRPDKPLPTPEEWAGQIPPKIVFSQGQRLEVLAKLKELGWKFVCDRSFMGLGKSHDAGSLYPDPDGTNKIWYFDQNHTNPSTETVEDMTNMPPRHNGMVAVEGKVTPRGNPHFKWAKSDEVPMVNSLCHNSELFVKLKQKGYNVDVEKSTVKDDDGKARERNPICKGCRFAGKCHQEIGDGYGYLFARREAMESRRIRSSLDSAPSPGDYKYDGDTAFVEEASRCLRGTQTLSARRQELSQLWDYVERKAPVAFAALQSIRFALADALEGKFDRIENGFNRGANHESLIANLPSPEDFANLPELLASVAQAMPKVKDLVEEPDSVTGLGGKLRSIGQLARNTFKAEAARQTQQNIEALPPNILVYALETWAGLRPGALRVSAKQLHVTIRDARHADVLTSCEFVCLLDATGDKRQLAQMLGVASDTIIEIEQEKPNLTNLTVTNANMKGMGSKRISDACKARQKAFLEWVITQHDNGEVRVLANLADIHLPLDGWWFNDNRSTNTFKGVEAIAAFNTPRVNLGAVQDEYLALFGNLEGFDEYYSYLIRAETIQLIGRQRAHLYPNRNFTIYLAGTNQDVSYLQEYGIRVINKEAFELCPEAGTPDQITRWKICLAMGQLQDQGQKLTQEAIASTIGVTQGRISQIVAEFGGWKSFKKILAVLLGLYRGTNNFSSLSDEEQWLARKYLPGLLDQPPEVAIQEVGIVIQAYGVSTFLRILAASTPQTQARLLALVIAGFAFEFLILDRGGGGVGSSSG